MYALLLGICLCWFQILLKFLEGGIISDEELQHCVRAGTLSFAFTPVLAGSAFKNKGVQCLLDAIVDYLPSPLDRPPLRNIRRAAVTPQDGGVNGALAAAAASEVIVARDDAPLAALAFKIFNDPFVGTLTFVRVYAGKYETRHRYIFIWVLDLSS